MRISVLAASTAALLAATPALANNPSLPPLEGADAGMATLSTSEHLAGLVKRIYPVADGTIYFRLVGACKTVTYFHFSTTSQAGRNWYAMLLSAAATARPVRISLVQPCNDAEHQAVQYVFQDP